LPVVDFCVPITNAAKSSLACSCFSIEVVVDSSSDGSINKSPENTCGEVSNKPMVIAIIFFFHENSFPINSQRSEKKIRTLSS
jgi:hypothetical protein